MNRWLSKMCTESLWNWSFGRKIWAILVLINALRTTHLVKRRRLFIFIVSWPLDEIALFQNKQIDWVGYRFIPQTDQNQMMPGILCCPIKWTAPRFLITVWLIICHSSKPFNVENKCAIFDFRFLGLSILFIWFDFSADSNNISVVKYRCDRNSLLHCIVTAFFNTSVDCVYHCVA